MLRLLAIPLALVALHQADSSIRPLSEPLKSNLAHGQWHAGCPVALADLRLVTVPYVDFEGRTREGQIIVHRDVAGAVSKVFRKYPTGSVGSGVVGTSGHGVPKPVDD